MICVIVYGQLEFKMNPLTMRSLCRTVSSTRRTRWQWWWSSTAFSSSPDWVHRRSIVEISLHKINITTTTLKVIVPRLLTLHTGLAASVQLHIDRCITEDDDAQWQRIHQATAQDRIDQIMEFVGETIERHTLQILGDVRMVFHMEYKRLWYAEDHRTAPGQDEHCPAASVDPGYLHRLDHCKISAHFE